jgi:hypothetical protein
MARRQGNGAFQIGKRGAVHLADEIDESPLIIALGIGRTIGDKRIKGGDRPVEIISGAAGHALVQQVLGIVIGRIGPILPHLVGNDPARNLIRGGLRGLYQIADFCAMVGRLGAGRDRRRCACKPGQSKCQNQIPHDPLLWGKRPIGQITSDRAFSLTACIAT